MAKSKNRKAHKQKAINYKKAQKAAKSKERRILTEQYREAQRTAKTTLNTQKNGENIDGLEVLDLDAEDFMDIGMDIPIITENNNDIIKENIEKCNG